MYKAFLFDLNGTMINDMEYHINAWYKLLNDLGACLSWDETKQECYGKNQEILERIFPGGFSREEKERISLEKEKRYQDSYRPHLGLIDGLDDFLEASRNAGIKMGIGTAAVRLNVDFVLDGLALHNYFEAIVSADDVVMSKPDPETFLKCAEQLSARPGECLVFEDSTKGTESAKHAGMNCIALTTMHNREEFDGTNILQFISSYEKDLIHTLIK